MNYKLSQSVSESRIESMKKSCILIIVLLSWPNYGQGFRYPSPILNHYNYNQSHQTVTIKPQEPTTTEESFLVKALSPQDVHRIMEVIVDGLDEFKNLPLIFAMEKEIEKKKKKIPKLSYSRMSRIWCFNHPTNA